MTMHLDNIQEGFKSVDFEAYSSYVYQSPVVPSAYEIASRRASPGWINQPPPPVSNVRQLPVPNKHGFQVGERITFKVEDFKDETGLPIILGNPVFEDSTIDMNIIVRLSLLSNENPESYFAHELWTARVTGIRPYNGVPMVYVNDAQPLITWTDYAGHIVRSDQLSFAPTSKTILLQRCQKCSGEMDLNQANKSLIHRKKSGMLRLVCPKCMEDALKTRENKLQNVH